MERVLAICVAVGSFLMLGVILLGAGITSSLRRRHVGPGRSMMERVLAAVGYGLAAAVAALTILLLLEDLGLASW